MKPAITAAFTHWNKDWKQALLDAELAHAKHIEAGKGERHAGADSSQEECEKSRRCRGAARGRRGGQSSPLERFGSSSQAHSSSGLMRRRKTASSSSGSRRCGAS